MEPYRIVIAGGGAAGFFGAIACAEAAPGARVTIYEATGHPLAKVGISGGGRCNVTHACFEPRELVTRYPRGARELLGPMTRFGPRETMDWFAARGVELKTEGDGRVFPVTDDSATVVNCLQSAAARAGVEVVTGCGVTRIVRRSFRHGWVVGLARGGEVECERVLVATGGSQGSGGMEIARALGHAIEPPVPSLFTLRIDDDRLRGLAGVSVPWAEASIAGTKLRESGAALVTHWGLSGPVILRLSAWGARELHAAGYHATLRINWAAPRTPAQVQGELAAMRQAHPRRQVDTGNPFALPARLWSRLSAAAGLAADVVWAGVSNQALRTLIAQLTAGEFVVTGRSVHKEEFVTCGGVRLSEVDFATMESRVCPGLYLAGEVLDIDGLTGGFNFQAAWTTGWHAGRAMAAAGGDL